MQQCGREEHELKVCSNACDLQDLPSPCVVVASQRRCDVPFLANIFGGTTDLELKAKWLELQCARP